MKKISFVLMLILSNQAFSAQYTVSGKVTMVFASTNPSDVGYSVANPGYLGMKVEGLPASTCGANGNAWVAIGINHPLYSSVLSLATAALISGNTVTLAYFNTCTVKSSAWDFSYLVVND